MNTSIDSNDEPRYAIYFAPSFDTALAQFGKAWFGKDPVTGEQIARPEVPGLDVALIEAATARPASYGFHATLKAPFRLKAGKKREALVASLSNFAQSREAFEISGLRPSADGAFVALTARKRASAMDALAAACMRNFDSFRAPMSDAERERRLMADTLSARQKSLLEEWGYPYVLDQFDFHMTLAGPISAEDRDLIAKALSKSHKALWKEPLLVDGVALFEQEPGEDFRVTERFAFAG